MVAVMLLDCMPLRSTTISCSLQAGLLGAAAFQRGCSLKVNCKASISNLLGTPPGSCAFNSLHTCNWWRQPWAFTEGVPSIMVLMWPLLNRGALDRVLFNWMMAYTKSVVPSPPVQAYGPTPQELNSGLCMDVPMTRPKTLLYPAVMLGMIRRNAMSHWGFSASPMPLPEKGCSVVPA